MVYCSHCGTQNRDGSKFCNICGARLMQESGLRCPMCSTPNPVENVFCVSCGARLVPLTAASATETKPAAPPIKGLSLPAKPDVPSEPVEPSESTEESAPPVASEPAAPLAPNEVPDWIARLRSSGTAADAKPESEEEPPADETPAQEDAGVPDWLSRLRSTPPAANASPADAESESETRVPSWITKSPALPATESASNSEEMELPDWLKQSKAEPEPTPEPPHSDATPIQEPDWLKQQETSQASDVDEKDLPDWLKQPAIQSPASEVAVESKEPVEELNAAEPATELTEPVEEIKATEPAAASTELVEESKVVEPAAALTEPVEESKAAEPAVTSTEPVEEIKATEPATELTEPVAEIKAAEPLLESLEEAEMAESEGREPFVLPELAASEDDEVPDWLRNAKSPEPGAVPMPAIEQPSPADVPSWVAELKPADLSPIPAAFGLATSEIESTGPLEGLRGVLPLAVAIAEPHRLEEAVKPPSQTDGGQIFESILAAPVQPPASAPKAARFALSMRPLIYLLLLLAVLVPFLLPFDLTQSTFSIAGTPAAEFYDTLQQRIPANSTALLSFDYDPSASGEMDLQVRAIVGDLIKRRVKIIAVSTLETGPQIAQRILGAAAATADKYVYGSNYIIVYLPGHEAGLAQLATAGFATATDYVNKQSVVGFLTAAKIKNLSDLPLVIEFAGSEEPLKTWVEQVQPHTGVRIAAAVSASVEPKARAYRNANQLTAMLSGLLGAAQYEALSSQPGIAVISVNAQSAAQIVLVFAILLGNVVFWISRARGGAK